MIEELGPYPEYKESGLPWLGQVPAHWGHLRAKYVFREVDERSPTGKEELLSVSHLTGVTPRSQKTITMFLAESNVGHKICRPGDVVINTMWAWMGALGVARHGGIVSPAYGVYRPLAGCAVLPRYADHLLRTPAYAAEYQRRSTGVNSSRLRLYPEQFLTIAVVVPPHNEQAAIVRFLEWADGQLERAIRTKRKLIVLLNEQKRAIIHHAVTRGLSHVGSLKDSGLDWIGKVPAHWNIVRCGQLFREVVDTGHPEAGLLSIDRFRGIIRQSETGRKERASEDRSAYKRIRPGELAYNLMNAFMGSIGISDLDSILSPAYAVAKPIREMTPAYFHHLFRTRLYTTQFDRYSYGIMYERNRLYFDRFKTIPALVPPLDEQARIVDYIADSTGRVDAAIDIRKRQIMLLQEYGNNLMSEAVTGKLDVRGLELPAIDEPELLGDLGQVEELEDSEPDEKVGLVEETADADN